MYGCIPRSARVSRVRAGVGSARVPVRRSRTDCYASIYWLRLLPTPLRHWVALTVVELLGTRS